MTSNINIGTMMLNITSATMKNIFSLLRLFLSSFATRIWTIAVAMVLTQAAAMHGFANDNVVVTIGSLTLFSLLFVWLLFVLRDYYRQQVPRWWPHGYDQPMERWRRWQRERRPFSFVGLLTTRIGAIAGSIVLAAAAAIDGFRSDNFVVAVGSLTVFAVMVVWLTVILLEHWRRRRQP